MGGTEGTLSLFAALNTLAGGGQHGALHTAQFGALLSDVLAAPTGARISDNLNNRKTTDGDAFLADHPNISMLFMPSYSFWLNQVENWFGRLAATGAIHLFHRTRGIRTTHVAE